MQTSTNNFDSLRLIAAWLVIVGHSFELLAIRSQFQFESLGAVGVIMFFSMSGYLVTQSLLRAPSIGDFLFKRALRILPALWVLVALSVFVWGALLTRFDFWTYLTSPTTQDYLLAMFLRIKLYLPGVFENNPLQPGFNGALWTLPLEARCYGVLALCALAGKRFVKPAVIVVLIVLAVAVNRHFNKGVFRVAQFHVDSYLFLKLVVPFFIGSALALWGGVRACNIWIGGIVVCAIAIGFKSAPQISERYWLVLAVAIGYFALSVALHTRGWLKPITRHGDFSYGLYLYAFPMQQMLISLHPQISVLALIVGTTLLTGACAWLSWRYVEAPMLSEKSRYLQWKASAIAIFSARKAHA